MRATLRLGLLLAVGVLVGGPARGDEDTDAVKRQIKIATDKLTADVRDGLREADKAAKSSVGDAIEILDDLEGKFVVPDIRINAETIKDLQDRVKARKQFYEVARTRGDRRYDVEERARVLRQQSEDFQKKQQEMRDAAGQIAQLYKQGKFDEAARLSLQRDERFGKSTSTAAVRRMGEMKKAFSELREIKDEGDRRHRELAKQLIRSTLPVVTESGMEFPADWRERSKRRQKVNLTKEEETLLRALQTAITEEFKDQPLRGVLDAFEKRYGVRFNVDRSALDQLMITDDAMVKVKARNTSLRTVVKQMLAYVGLTYVIVKGELLVTTPEKAAARMIVRTYYIGDLLNTFNQPFDPFGQNQLAAIQTLASIVEMIKGIEPQTWADNNGGTGGTITFNPGTMSLQIKQSAEMHYTLQGAIR